MGPLPLLLLGALLAASALHASAKAPKGSQYRERCGEMCQQIETCAAKVKRQDLSKFLCHMATCEVGKLCRAKEIRSPNGLFRGPFQFTTGTWRSICQPLFKRDAIDGCSGAKSIYDPCCATMCAAEIVAHDLNGGLKNWPICSKEATRAMASEK